MSSSPFFCKYASSWFFSHAPSAFDLVMPLFLSKFQSYVPSLTNQAGLAYSPPTPWFAVLKCFCYAPRVFGLLFSTLKVACEWAFGNILRAAFSKTFFPIPKFLAPPLKCLCQLLKQCRRYICVQIGAWHTAAWGDFLYMYPDFIKFTNTFSRRVDALKFTRILLH